MTNRLLFPILALGLAFPAFAADVDNPACELLAEAEVSEAFGVPVTENAMNPEMTGSSDCSWAADRTGLALSRSRGMAFQGSSVAADSYRAWRDSFASSGNREDLDGIGEAAFIFMPGNEPTDTGNVVAVLSQGNVLILGGSGLSRGALIDLAARAARRI